MVYCSTSSESPWANWGFVSWERGLLWRRRGAGGIGFVFICCGFGRWDVRLGSFFHLLWTRATIRTIACPSRCIEALYLFSRGSNPKESLINNVTMLTGFSGEQLVVPLPMKLIPLQMQLRHLLVRYFDTAWIGAGIKLGVHFQPFERRAGAGVCRAGISDAGELEPGAAGGGQGRAAGRQIRATW